MATVSFNPESLAPDRIRALHAYVPGQQPRGDGWIKLNTNELPYPCSPQVAPAIVAEVPRAPLYPSPTSAPLREAIAKHHGLGFDQVIVGNGSDDLLNLLTRAFCDVASGPTMTFPSYSLYPVLAAIQGSKITPIPFEADMALPLDALLRQPPSLLFLTSPNAPTGVGFPLEKIETLLGNWEGLVVVDEAYADFALGNATNLLSRFPNLVITRTFSKSYGLAGLRVGYALGDARVIALLDKVRDSYNVNRLSQAGALAAFLDQDYLRQVVSQVVATRDRFAAFLDELGWFTYPSQTNFVFTQPQTRTGTSGLQVAAALDQHLRDRHILVRRFEGGPRVDGFLRISIGTDAQMDTLKEALHVWNSNA